MSLLNQSNKNILFIAPYFYNYENLILREIEAQGYDVSKVFYSYGAHVLPWKVQKLKRKINDQKTEILSLIRKKKFDILFVIKGEIITRHIINEFKNRNPNSKTINYQWDSIDNSLVNIDTLSAFDFIYTFDHLDIQKHNSLKLRLRPLFFCDAFMEAKETSCIYDIATVGGMQLHRVKLLKLLQKRFPDLRFKILLRTSITLNLPFNLLKLGVKSYFKFLLLKDLSKAEVAAILKRSIAIIDIPDPNQSGLSMRTLEVLAMKRKIITTNANISKYHFFHPQNILILSTDTVNNISEFISKPFINIDETIEKYSLKNWVFTILNNKNEAYLKGE